jgi:hypothetical protein
MPRGTPFGVILDEYHFVKKLVWLLSPVRSLRHIATFAFYCYDRQARAAQAPRATLAKMETFASGEPPPKALLAQRRNAAFYLNTRTEHGFIFLKFLVPSALVSRSKVRHHGSSSGHSANLEKARQ